MVLRASLNLPMAFAGQKIRRFFKDAEMIKMKCDVHSWMTSYIGVLDNPFHEVTSDGGRFELKGLPAGTFAIEAWHETYGSTSQTVTLADGESKSVEFQFGH